MAPSPPSSPHAFSPHAAGGSGDGVEDGDGDGAREKSAASRGIARKAYEDAKQSVKKAYARVYDDERSLLCFSEASRVRQMCATIAQDARFQVFVFAVVALNAAVLAMELPERAYAARGGSIPLTAAGSWALQVVFVVVFAFEALVKVIASGFVVGPKAYLTQRSNMFDFVVVVVGIVDLSSSGSSGVGTLRLLRTIQPLRALNKFKSGRMVLETIRKSIPLLLDVVVFMSWFVIVCTVIGMMSFGGRLNSREYSGAGSSNATATAICNTLVAGYPTSAAASAESPNYPSDELLCLHRRTNTLVSNDTYCCDSGTSPVDGFVNFDDFAKGAFVVLQIMTVDGWNEIAWPTARAVGTAPALIFYFVVVLIGGFFVLQLFTSVICATLSDIEDESAALDRETLGDGTTSLAGMFESSRFSVYSKSLLSGVLSAISSFKVPGQDEIDDSEGMQKWRLKALALVADVRFESFVNVVIMLNTFAMMSVTADPNPSLEVFRENAEYVFFAVFCSEFALKNFAAGPVAYWKTTWNRLDGLVVLSGVVDMTLAALSSGAGVNLSFLRMLRVLRILRIARVFRKSTSFQKILRAVVMGAQRIWVFLLVWVIFMIMFAILGTQLFSAKGDLDDERLNFRDFFSSVVTLFVVSTGENTFEVAWATMKADGDAAGLYMVVWCLITTSILALVLGILIDSITDESKMSSIIAKKLPMQDRFAREMAKSMGFDEDDFPEWVRLKADEAWIKRKQERSSAMSAIDAVLGLDEDEEKKDSDDDDGDDDEVEDDEVAQGVFDNPFEAKRLRKERVARLRRVHEVAVVRHWLVTLGYERHSEKSLKVAKTMRRRAVIKARERLAKSHKANELKRRAIVDSISAKLSGRNDVAASRLVPLSIRCIMTKEGDLHAELNLTDINGDFIPHHALFIDKDPAAEADSLVRYVSNDNFRIAMSFYGIDEFDERDQLRLKVIRLVRHPWFDIVILLLIGASSILLATETNSFPAADSNTEKLYLILDICFNTCFTIEMCLKLFGLGAWKFHGSYLRSKFNIMDAFVVVTSWLIVLLGDALPIRSLRVVRVLRPLRSVKRIKGLRVVVEAIMSSLPAISSVCVVGLAMLTMLSVLGMELFLGKMHRCTLTAVAVSNKTQCLAAGGVWRKAKFNFDSFPEAFLSVFIIATGDNWQDLMYEAMDVVGKDQEPIRDHAKWACVYFFVSILFGFLLWANLFVSALIDNFNRIANEQNDGKLFITDEQRVWQQAMLLAMAHADNSWRRTPPETPWKAVVHRVVSKYAFDAFSVFMIVLNMVTMMAIRANPSKSEDDYQVWMGNTLAIWYMLEAYLLIVAMKWTNYWRSGWNKIDFIVAVSGIIGLLIPAVYESGVGGAFRMLRFLRLFKIVQVSKGLRTLFATFLAAIPGVVNVAILSLLFMYIYACLGVAFFGDMSPDYVGAALSEYSNFVTFPKAMVSLFVSYTGNWQGYFTDIYVDDRCYENTPLPADVTCSPRYVSVFYFVTYVITGVFFLGNLFIAIILERFSFCASEEGVGGSGESNFLYATMTLKRVARQISRSVREATKLTPSERRDIYFEKRRGRSNSVSGAATPDTPHLSKNNSIQRASDASTSPASASPHGEFDPFDDPTDEVIEGARSELEDIRDETQSPFAFEDDLDFEDVKSALREALPTHDAASLLAAANAVDRLVRSRSRSRSVSRGRASAPSTSDVEDVNRSDDDEGTVKMIREAGSMTTPSRGRSVARVHSQRSRVLSATARMKMATSAGSSRRGSSDEESDEAPRAYRNGSRADEREFEESSDDESLDYSRL